MGFYTMSASSGELLGGWCNAVLYGFNIFVFGACIYILVQKRKRGTKVSMFFFTCAIVQFIISTLHVALNLKLLMNAFLGEQSPEVYLAQETQPEQIGLKALYFTNSAIGDAVLVWRMYKVWGRNANIAILPVRSLPSLMVAASAAAGFVATSIIAQDGDASWPLILKYLLASWSLSVATQVTATCAIAVRIWRCAARIPAHVTAANAGDRPDYKAIVWIIIESGAVYTAATIVLLAFFVVNSQASNIVGKALGQISSIVPTLIIVRVNITPDLRQGSDAPVSLKFLQSLAPSSHMDTGDGHSGNGSSLTQIYSHHAQESENV